MSPRAESTPPLPPPGLNKVNVIKRKETCLIGTGNFLRFLLKFSAREKEVARKLNKRNLIPYYIIKQCMNFECSKLARMRLVILF